MTVNNFLHSHRFKSGLCFFSVTTRNIRIVNYAQNDISGKIISFITYTNRFNIF
jgi:hypothetical protein